MTKKDIKLIIILGIASIIGILGLMLFTSNRAKSINIVSVYHNNDIILTFDINQDGEYEVEGDYGHMIIEVKDKQYHVKEVECPNHDCQRIGWVKQGSPTAILCVPNNIFIDQDVIDD